MDYLGNIINSVIADCAPHFDLKGINALQMSLALQLSKYNLSEKDYSLTVYKGDENKELFENFINGKRLKGLSNRTIKYYQYTLLKAFTAINKNILDITTDDLRSYLAYKSIKDGVSSVSLNNIKRVLNSFFSYLVIHRKIEYNPVLLIDTIKEPRRMKKPFTEEETEILRASAKNIRDRAIIDTLISTACRVSELVSINLQDVNFETGSIYIIGKGNKEREVYLNAKAKISLKKYIDSRQDRQPGLFCGLRAALNKRLQAAGVEIMLRKLGRSVGIPNVHPHRFRRTAATQAHYRGMTISEVSSYLGHSNLNTTALYTIMNREEVKSAHRKFIS